MLSVIGENDMKHEWSLSSAKCLGRENNTAYPIKPISALTKWAILYQRYALADFRLAGFI